MIIFGWGHQTTKNFGPTFKNHCSHCNNDDYWTLARYITWFTLFFIPVLPYSTKYFLSCPVCQYGLTLNSEQVAQFKPIAEINQLLIDHKITEVEYKIKIEQLSSGAKTPVKAEIIDSNTLAKSTESSFFCSECGSKLTEDIKFCGNCGAKISK